MLRRIGRVSSLSMSCHETLPREFELPIQPCSISNLKQDLSVAEVKYRVSIQMPTILQWATLFHDF